MLMCVWYEVVIILHKHLSCGIFVNRNNIICNLVIPTMLACTQVNNACSTGSTALMLAKQLVEGNMSDCVLALGFEKMERGSLTAKVCMSMRVWGGGVGGGVAHVVWITNTVHIRIGVLLSINT